MMNNKKNNFFRRITNFKVFFSYIKESFNVIRQGASFKDKLILSYYYLRIPGILAKSLFTGKGFRELEEDNRYLSGNVTLKNQNGIFFCGNNINAVYTIEEQNEKHLYPYFKIKDGYFLDIGAHLGKYSIKLGRNPANKIIAIEPDKFNFALLERNVALNRLTNIICINKGAFSAKGEIPFYISGEGEGQNSIFGQDRSWEATTIETDTIDSIIKELGRSVKIDLIKIDVEGAESEVLEGAQQTISKDHPELLIEILKENIQNLEKVKRLLIPHNYTMVRLDDDNYLCR